MVPPPEPALVSDKSRLRDVAKNCIYIPERGGGGPVFQRVKIELIAADLPEKAARIEAAERQLPSALEGHLSMGREHHDPARRYRLKNPAQPRPEAEIGQMREQGKNEHCIHELRRVPIPGIPCGWDRRQPKAAQELQRFGVNIAGR